MSQKITEATCVDLDDFGRGIVRIDNVTCFVDNLLPGEKAEIATVFEYGKLADCYVERRLSDSPDRIKPICPYYPECGGCQLMHLSYPKQLEYKTQKVKDLFHKFAHLDVEVQPTIGLDQPTRFRNKVQKPIRLDDRTNRPIAGFFETGTHRLVGVEDCLMETALSNKITNVLLRLFVQYDYYPFDEDRMTGEIRHVLIKTSSAYDKALVTLVTTTADLPGRVNFAKDLINQCPEVVGLVLNINTRHTNVILGEREVEVYGHTHISDQIFGKDFLISSQSFYQTNAKQIETLYGKAIEAARIQKTDRVLDAYCGTGTIGLSLANQAQSVVGVEINHAAIKDALLNAKINKITNVRFVCADATDYILNAEDKFDVIVLDPPRKGSTPEFIDACLTMAPRSIVYVSCDPVTLARDIALFSKAYDVVSVQPVDMFPNTMHVETVVALSLRKN
jgi:23S rRNA (uracil1939-C5)-methyltransferase